MIVIHISGGLANKMFQYAFSVKLRSLGHQVAFDTSSFKSEFAHDTATLGSTFPAIQMPEYQGSDYPFLGKRGIIHRTLRRLNPKYVYEKGFRYNKDVFSKIRCECCIDGLWQSPRYFDGCEALVRESYVFKIFSAPKNIELAAKMASCNSVAIHIRKGDGYAIWPEFKNTCTQEYYRNAIQMMRELVRDPKFFLFSDNIPFAKSMMEGIEHQTVDWNPISGEGNYLDMQLMSQAKHNIIANSTYSWWGAWLNSTPEKIVIGPKNWFNPQAGNKYSKFEIIPSKWITL